MVCERIFLPPNTPRHALMKAIEMILGWFFRQGFVFILIVAAIAFQQLVLPKILSGEVSSTVKNEWKSAETITNELKTYKDTSIAQFEKFQTDLHTRTAKDLDTALTEKKEYLSSITKELKDRDGIFPPIRPDAILKIAKLKFDQNVVAQEIKLLELALDQSQDRKSRLRNFNMPLQNKAKFAEQKCGKSNKAVKSFNDRIIRLNYKARKLTKEAKINCKIYVSVNTKLLAAFKIECIKLAQNSREKILLKGNEFSKSLKKSSFGTIEPINSILLRAFYVLVGIILTPFFIRIVFYYILAPIAERRASIVISVPNAGKVPIPLADFSRVSVPVTLEKNEELLIRQDYLQSSSLEGKKQTRWMLDYRHMLSSLASGLVFLTRIQGEGETTTVSAVRDPFAELTTVTLPQGAACVLHPRALVAVVHPVGQTMQITSHWRLFALNAWLTMQLRYLVFHGPCSLIVKGGRGIRVERAERGRIFGQDQLVGFSADLAYSVTRAETFAPYFFGREQLYKDKVERGSGILIIEEAPQASREGGGVRRGIEGAFDAGLKAFGL